jgi:hypothetical protein
MPAQKEEPMPRIVEVAKRSQIPECGAMGVAVEGKNLALVNLKGEIGCRFGYRKTVSLTDVVHGRR